MDAALERPFYFIVVLWGARFRAYFLEYCVPSLLAPGNLPSLSTKAPSKFLIVTRPEDWTAIQASPIFQVLGRYITPVFIEIAPCPPGRSGCQHMSLGHRIACEMAHRDKAYAAVLTPDCMLSDGSVARLMELARNGVQLVLAAALRFGEEPFLGHLHDQGVLPSASRSATGTPLVVSGRQMAYAAVNGFHSETLAYEWDAPGVLVISPAAWWRVPGEDGIVLHSLSWAPLLLDYSAVDDHDTSTFDQWTLDGDYLFNNAKDIKQIHVVQDSDELFIASWGPLAERPLRKTRFPFDRFWAGHFFRQSFYSGFFDPLKRKIFFLPVRWHAKPLNDRWTAVEERAARELQRWVEAPDEMDGGESNSADQSSRILALARAAPVAVLRSMVYMWIFRHRIGHHIGRMVRGDHAAFSRIVWFARSFMLGTGSSSRPLP